MSGYPEALKQYGDFFSHDKTARALIFARNQSQVTDMDSLHALMRWVWPIITINVVGVATKNINVVGVVIQ